MNIISGGNAPFTYLWSDGQTTATADSLSAGTYTCIITYNNDCDTSVTVTINLPELIDTNVTINSCGTFIWYDTFFDSSGQYVLTLSLIHI